MTERTQQDDLEATTGSDNNGATTININGGESWISSFVHQTMTERSGGSADGGERLFRQLRNFLNQHQPTSPTPRNSRDSNSNYNELDLPTSSHNRSGNQTLNGSVRRTSSTSNDHTIIDVEGSPNTPLMDQTDGTDLYDLDSEHQSDNANEDFTTTEGLRTGLRLINQHMNRPETPVYCFLYIIIFIPFLLLVLLKNILDSFYESIAFLVIVVGHFTMSHMFMESGNRGVKYWLMMGGALFLTYETLFHMEAVTFLKESLLFMSVFKSSDTITFASIFYVVMVTCYTAKTIFLVAKLAVSVSPFVSEKRKRRLYQWIEYSCILYCDLLPFPQWLAYFNNTFFLILYILLKFFLSSRMIRDWVLNTRCLFRLTTIGSIPTSEEIAKEDRCSICCSSFCRPIKLSCNHLFCEDCVTTWLDKQDTCPMCRQTVTTEDNKFKNGESQLMPPFY